MLLLGQDDKAIVCVYGDGKTIDEILKLFNSLDELVDMFMKYPKHFRRTRLNFSSNMFMLIYLVQFGK